MVLKGSISASCSATASDSSDTPNKANRIKYLIAHKRSCTAYGNSICGNLIKRPNTLTSSCRAPNGHNQPQYTARPHNSMVTAAAHHKIKMIGSSKNRSHEKSFIRACKKVNTLTMDNCPPHDQPISTTVTTRKP